LITGVKCQNYLCPAFSNKIHDNHSSNSLKFTACLISRFSILFTYICMMSHEHQIFIRFLVPNTHVGCLL